MRQNRGIASNGDFKLVLLFLDVVAIGVPEVWVEVAVEWTCAERYQTSGRIPLQARVRHPGGREEKKARGTRGGGGIAFPTVYTNASKNHGSNRDENEPCELLDFRGNTNGERQKYARLRRSARRSGVTQSGINRHFSHSRISHCSQVLMPPGTAARPTSEGALLLLLLLDAADREAASMGGGGGGSGA